jgi:hypothetical protein
MKVVEHNKETDLIKNAIIDYYHEGHVKADSNLYEQVLHDEWKFFMFDDQNQLKVVDKKEYYSWYDPKKVDSSLQWKTEFFYVDVYENNAQAKISIENQNVKYIDYFNLMKVDGTWWIVHKISQPIRK